MSDHRRNILLCVSGLTPQIVTETLYALAVDRGERVDEIHVITTVEGLARVERTLLDPRSGKVAELCRDYDLDRERIRFERSTIHVLERSGAPLDDIRTRDDNIAAADQICEIVRELTADPETRLHASAAGGRKTMSVFLTAAMQLFGRADDTLSHVLVSRELETQPDFFYMPPEGRHFTVDFRDPATGATRRVSTAEARIHLAEIPFVRLRRLLLDRVEGGRNYGELVARAQRELAVYEKVGDLRVDLAAFRLHLVGEVVRLTPSQIFWYSMLAARRAKRSGGDGFVAADEIDERDLDETFRRITRARGGEVGLDDADLVPKFDFLGDMRKRVASANPLDREDLSRQLQQLNAKIAKKILERGPFESYCVGSRSDGGKTRYGIAVSPERITIA